MTNIISNGSHWAGDELDTIDQLCAVLESEPLDPLFENCGNFSSLDKITGVTSFFGNFFTTSHVFRIDSDEAATVNRLNALIVANQATEAYASAKAERAGNERYWADKREEERAARRRRAFLQSQAAL